MHARRTSESSLALPSSPPIAAQQLGEAHDPSEERSVVSPAQTLWTALSPTLTLANSSPELPTLPTLSALGRIPRTPSTVARNDRPDDTSFYTASWGSPYRHPPPVFNPQRQASTNLDSDDFDEGSSALQFGLGHLLPPRLEVDDDAPSRFNLDHLIPQVDPDGSPNQFTLENLIQSRLPRSITPTRESQSSGFTPRASDKNPTSEEWVRSFLEERWNREKGKWKSDISFDIDSNSGSDLDEDFLLPGPPKRGHKGRNNNKTLNQQDFWRHISKEQKDALGKMMASKYADEPTSHPREASGSGPAAPPQFPPRTSSVRNLFASPISPQDATPSHSPKPIEQTPNKPPTPVEPTRTPIPRTRKKIMVKGKGCVISIPHDIPRGTHGYPPKPMSPAAVEAKMQNLQRLGYNTRGFGHWNGVDVGDQQAHNRSIWPTEDDVRAERASIGTNYKVYVPKQSEWEQYKNSLVEAKLAALGVSLGGDDEAPAPMSRQASGQYPGLPFSPPLPTPSGGSHRGRQGSVVTGPFPFGPSPGHMSRQSIASPAAFANVRPSMHMHRHSTFGPGSFSHHGISPSGTWSPGGYFGSQDGRGGSPALPALPPSRPDLAGIVSPHSPFGRRASQQFPHSPLAQDDLMVQMQMQQQQVQAQVFQQQQQQLMGLRPSSTLAEVPEGESEEEALPPLKNVTKAAPEIAHPTPRNHRHNLSENMEREAADAEYHLEEAIDKQFAEGGDFNTEPEITGQRNAVANNAWETSRPILHQPQPHNRTHSITKSQQQAPFAFPAQQSHNPRDDSNGVRTNLSENTNPSLEDGEIHSNQHSQASSQVSNPWKDSKFAYDKSTSVTHSKHASKPSLSKLNVEAKEFKFNPAASFNPGSVSNNKPSLDGLSSFNVTAPAFKPDVAAFKPTAPAFKPVAEAAPSRPAASIDAPEFKPAVPAFPSSGFSFSSPPAFKPDAPAFNPGAVSAFDPQRPTPAPTSFSSKIFGDVNISANDIIKPATRSKAVAIVRPDTARESSPETVKEAEDREDAEGRPMQAEGREKRARKVRDDGDEVPKFALQPILASQPLAKPGPIFGEKADLEETTEDKENRSPDGRKPRSKSRSPERFQPTVEAKQPVEQAEAAPIVAPTTADPVADPAKKHAHKKSSLSATAKPFELKPQSSSAGYDFGFHVTKPSRAEDFDDKPQNSPPRGYSRSPATTYRPSDDGSFKTALGHRVPYAESESVDFDPSFNDIDAVMKQMDEGGSDFGVERNDDSWEQSSPQRTPHEFDHFNLRPNVHLRSDAPSPSPRRMYANQQGSATSLLQNPFDDERAALVSASPVHRLNHAEDLPVSDWDDILTEGEEQVKMRSSFFDKRVDDLMGRLLQNRLGPLEQTLQNVQHALTSMSSRPSRGRRSLSTAGLDSDADDEDDDIGTDAHYRNRSPRKDRRLEKIRSVVREALESHQAQAAPMSAAAPEPLEPEKIREILADVLVSHQPPAASVEHVSTEQIRAIVEDAIASNKPPKPETEPLKPEDIKSMLTETFGLYEFLNPRPIRPDDVRTIVEEAFATHAPQPAPIGETLTPDAIRSIITETITSHQPQAPIPSIVEPMQPDTIRSIVTEALASQKSSALEAPIDIPQPQFDISEMYQVIGSLKASIAQTTSNHLQADDVRELVDDAFKRQSMEVAKREESEAILKRDARIAELESMVEDSTLRHEAEEAARNALEDREADTARLLKVTEEELTLLQAAAKDDETRIRALTEERDAMRRSLNAYQTDGDDVRDKLAAIEAENEGLKMKNIALETSEEDLKTKLDAVTAENEALTFTLEEHRKSANKWRGDIQEAHQENEKLREAINQARYQAEEAARVRESMRGKFEKLQQDMVLASQQIAAERSQWQKNEQASLEKYEVLSARIEAEGRTRERLERELERLETQEGEGMKLRIHFEQAQKHNARLEETIEQLRRESIEHQNNAHRYERDMREAREAAHVEIRRTRVLMEADLDAANNQVNVVRHNLESEVARVRAELDSVRMEAETAREKHELELEAASDATKQAVEEALQRSKRTQHEQQQAFERGFERLKQEHTRALEYAREDKQRADTFHNDKLALADSKLDHFKDKIALLEEKLVVAKEAASAAAAAAAKSPTASAPSTLGSHEKISPQALRESISVLQEQLQERESRIESLEQKLADVDTEAPAKLKERDTEITWLRELLGVRVDDINDLINALAQPTFDRETVRDAAIRIRTNLQMEQSEKERLISGAQNTFPTLATLSNFASPKAVQVAAAFGNWRKGRQNATSALAGPSASNSRNQTPSRPATHSAQSFLSGLMTPPTSNMRRTPDFSSSAKPKDLRSNSTSSHSSSATEQGFPSLGKQSAAPSTPPLLRKASYDRDAAVEDFSDAGYDDDSTVDGGEVTPIALNFGHELRSRRDRE